MRNNHFFKTQILLAALAAAVIAPISAFTQQRPAARTSTIKDSDIYVPEKVLEPSLTKKEASDLLKEYIAAFGDSDMPRSYEAFARDPDKYKRIGSRQLKSSLGNLYNYIFDASLRKKESDPAPVNPELMEVTEATEGWFRKLYNQALELNEPAAMMDKAIRLKNATMYTQATKAYADKLDELNKFVKKPERLDAAALKRLIEANKAKRKAAYLELRKQQLLEQEAAAKAAFEEEMKKAKSSKK